MQGSRGSFLTTRASTRSAHFPFPRSTDPNPDQSLDEIKLLQYIKHHDPEDKYNVLHIYDYFYHKERTPNLYLP